MTTSPSSAKRFPVVMLYDNFESVGKAMATYSQLTHELDSEFKPDLRIWRLDVALSPECSAEANHDIEAAEVIIMTVHGNEPCPPEFLHWKTRVGQGEGVPHRAIIAILESTGESDPATESWSSVLRGVGTEIHPELFVCEVEGESSGDPFGSGVLAFEPEAAGV
jgi:hypothetical protein